MGELGARATFVVLPDDAATAANAMAAGEEGLAAAKAGDRRVVAFDRGRLDGVDYSAGYTASLAQRRAAILEMLARPRDDRRPSSSPSSRWTTAARWASSRSRASAPSPSARRTSGSPRPTPSASGLEIEVECVRRACRLRAHASPDGAYLSVNMSPDAILIPEMERGARRRTASRAWSSRSPSTTRCATTPAWPPAWPTTAAAGAKVAIDDAGAGHASMRHVTQLAPDYIKIDRSLIHDIHLDHAKRALVRSMVTLEKELGARGRGRGHREHRGAARAARARRAARPGLPARPPRRRADAGPLERRARSS